jgi:hypothetical protein
VSTDDQERENGADESGAVVVAEANVPGDAVVEAIEDVARAVRENVHEEQELLSELDHVRDQRMAGVPLTHAIGVGGPPRVLWLLGRVVNRLVAGSAVLRRALVTSLVEEGDNVMSVARRFEVSHQRISAILRRSSN